MRRRAKVINALTKGVLDPRLAERIDLAHYYTSVRVGHNVMFRPQGGFRTRFGTHLSYPGRLRRIIEPIDITASMITAHNGGDATALTTQRTRLAAATLDTPPTKPSGATTDPPKTFSLVQPTGAVFTTDPVTALGAFVVFEIDLGVAVECCFVDLIGFAASDKGIDDVLAVEYWTGVAWQSVPCSDRADLPPRKNLGLTAHTRRFGGPPGWQVSSQHWRVVAHDAASCGAISIEGVALWRETTRVGAVKLFAFAKSVDDTTEMVLTDRNIDVFDGSDFLCSISSPVGVEDLDLVKIAAREDTVFLYHSDFEPLRLERQGQPDEWDQRHPAFAKLPALYEATSYGGSVDEIQVVTFPTLVPGQQIVLWLEGARTARFAFTSPGNLPDDIVAALTAVPGMPSSGISASLEQADPPIVRVAFTDAAGGRRWPKISSRVIGVGDGSTEILQRGVNRGGAIMEPATGWPRCGAIHQQRHILGGLRAAPRTLLFSELGDPFSFDPVYYPALATKSIQVPIDSEQSETIYDVFVGRHLQVFTEAGEWWSDNRSFSATEAVNMILASRYGFEPRVHPAFLEEATVYLGQRDVDAESDAGQVLRSMTYNLQTDNYISEPLNILGPHLLTTVVSMAVRKARSINQGNIAVLVNADGSLAFMTMLKAQEVLAVSSGSLAGAHVRSVIVDAAGRMFLATLRNGDHWIERCDDAALLDATVAVAGAGVTSVAVPHIADGDEAWAVIDGDIYGPITVAHGTVALPVATVTSASVGRRIVPIITTNPLREKLQEDMPFRLPARIYEVELSLVQSTHVALAINGGTVRELPLRFADGRQQTSDRGGEETREVDMDTPETSRLFTGRATRESLLGVSRHPFITITQVRPGPLEVRAIRYEVAS